MRTVRINVGTKRNNSVSDNVSTITLDDVDAKFNKLLALFGKVSLSDVRMQPVTSPWGTEWTIVATFEVSGTLTRGKDIAEIACLIFEQEAVPFKEWDDENGTFLTPFGVDSGLTYHMNFNGEKDEFNRTYFVGNDFEG
jgi:hypothetical protein